MLQINTVMRLVMIVYRDYTDRIGINLKAYIEVIYCKRDKYIYCKRAFHTDYQTVNYSLCVRMTRDILRNHLYLYRILIFLLYICL